MREVEGSATKDITELFRQRVLSGERDGSIYFWDDLRSLNREGITSLSISISATDLPAGRERNICNFLKAFLEKDRGCEVLITGTQEQYEHLVANGCANALASGVKFEKVE